MSEYIKPENYAEGYNESIQALKDKPEVIELDRVCHALLTTPEGKIAEELLTERFLLPALSNVQSTNFSEQAIYFEGFKEFLRMLINCKRSHQQRIDMEGKK